MKLHTLNREYCLCIRHSRKLKKKITLMTKRFIKEMDKGMIPIPMKYKAKGPFLEQVGSNYLEHWVGPKHPQYKEIK